MRWFAIWGAGVVGVFAWAILGQRWGWLIDWRRPLMRFPGGAPGPGVAALAFAWPLQFLILCGMLGYFATIDLLDKIATRRG